MKQHYYYWKWENVLPKELIDLALKELAASQPVQGEIDPQRSLGTVDNKVRSSKVAFAPNTHWLASILANYTYNANQITGWKRTLTVSEGVQFGIYEPGDFYDWHADNIEMSAEDYGRKLSSVILLNDPSEFEGGAFEFMHADTQPDMKQGTLLVFPSILRHRVAPITSGKRISAVSWVHGPTEW